MSKAPRRRLDPNTEPVISADQKLAYVICFWVYGRGCECRERNRGQVCDVMMSAGFAARRQIETEASHD